MARRKAASMIELRAQKAEVAASTPGRRAARRKKLSSKPGDFLVVGIGASAGGLEALKKLFDALPAAPGMALILIQHLDPTHKSMMAELLAKHTSMKVLEAANAMPIARDQVYIIPPGADLSIRQGALQVTKPRERHGVRMPFDRFLRSLADEYGERAVCAVLSGTGADGSVGVMAVHDKGGLVIVQDPKDAAYDGMPRNAIMTGAADLVLPVAKIPDALAKYSGQARGKLAGSKVTDETGTGLPAIIDLLRTQTSHDFTLYKEGTLQRQIERRMATASIRDLGDYLNAIRKNPKEIELLAKDMLIHVTRFFRDKDAFDVMAKTVVADLVRQQPLDKPIRIWNAGCSTGEETYSIVMLFLEEIAATARNVKLQVFASDVDADAVAAARNGTYSEAIENDVSPARLKQFFVKDGHSYRVTRALRETVVFTTQDLLADVPFSRLDFVSCRNLLIYLRPEVQEKVVSLFHFALREGGILVLGNSESIGDLGDRFEPVSKKQRIFRHLGRSRPGEVEFPITAGSVKWSTPAASRRPESASPHAKIGGLAQQALLETYAPASVLINVRNEGLYFFGPTDRYLKVATGEASRDIMAMARDGLRTRLRAAIRQASWKHASVALGGAQMDRNGSAVSVNVSVQPVQSEGEEFLLVSFADEPEPKKRGETVAQNTDSPHVELLEQELDATRKQLEGAIDTLGMTNDELTATNEEASSVNEELQSTNEELETSKEELQSLNEELTALNSQLTETIEVQRATASDLRNTMNSANFAMLFLDGNLKIRLFTAAAKSMFSVIASDVGRPLADLARLTNDTHLLADAATVLASQRPLTREVETDGGAWYTRRVLPYRAHDDHVEGVVVTFADISERKTAERAIDAARAYSDSIINTIPQPLVVLDAELRVISASRSFYRTFSVKPEETVGRQLDAINDGRLDIAALHGFLDRLRHGEGSIENHEVEVELPTLGPRSLLVNALEIHEDAAATRKILVTIDDVTERKRASAALEAARLLAEQANLGKTQFLAAASHDLRQPLQTLSLLQGILAKRIQDPADAKLVAKFEETLGAMSGMLNTLLDINQLEAGTVRPGIVEFQIGALLDRLNTEFAYHATAKDLSWRVVSSTLQVRSDPRLLEQMLRNLLSNAVKYTERGKVLLGCRRRGDMLRIEVWDTGIGIPADQHKAIFEEFRQLHNAARERSRGFGLGLSIVQRIGDLLGNPVNVRSWPGSGSVFTVEVPLGNNERPQERAEATTDTVPSLTGAILIIEDDPAVRDVLEILFEGEGYQTIALGSTIEALALAARGTLHPDVIVADYNLPGDLTGAEVIKRLRLSLGSEIPAIILTGDISTDTLNKIFTAGCVHLSKPTKADTLIQQVQSFLAAKPRRGALGNARHATTATGVAQPVIFVVDDDRAVRDSMQALLRAHGYTAETYASGEAFLALDRHNGPGCLLVDALMPGMDGIALLERLKAENCELPAIMITGHGAISMAVLAMKAGAADFLEKPVRPDELIAGIERALELVRDLSKTSARRSAAAECLARLTPRERDVLDLVVQGRPNKIIADDLGISQRTVETHRAAVMKRTGVASLPDLIRLVMAAANEPSTTP